MKLGGFNSRKGDLVDKTSILIRQITAMWKNDSYMNYMEVNSELDSVIVKEDVERSLNIANESSFSPSRSIQLKAHKKSNSHSGNATEGSSMLQQLLKGGDDHTGSPRSSKYTGDKMDTDNGDYSDEDNMDLLHSLPHEKQNFFVTSKEGVSIKVSIPDEIILGSGAVNPIDMRLLLSQRPDIALLLYDCMAEEKIGDTEVFHTTENTEKHI